MGLLLSFLKCPQSLLGLLLGLCLVGGAGAAGEGSAEQAALLKQAREYLDIDRPADALSLLEEGGVTQEIHYWRIRRDALADQGEWKAALQAARGCLQLDGADPYVDRLALGDALFGAAEFDQARVAYNQCIQLEPKRSEAYLQRAKILAWQSRIGELGDVLKEVQPHLTTAAEWDQYARLQLLGGNLDQAQTAGLKAAELDPSQGKSYSLIAAICEAKRIQGRDAASQKKAAADVADKADEVFRSPGRNRAERLAWDSAIHIASGRLDQGLRGAGRLILNRTVAYQVIGLKMKIEVLLQLGYGADVLQEARRLTDLQPDAFEPLMLRAQVELAAGYRERGVQQVEQAIALRPNDYRAYLVKARILWASGQHDKALAVMSRAEELAGEDVTPAWEAGLWFFEEGAWSDAAARFQRVRDYNVNHRGAMVKWAQCHLHLNPSAERMGEILSIVHRLKALQDDRVLILLRDCINHDDGEIQTFGLEQMAVLFLANGLYEKAEPLVTRLKERGGSGKIWRALDWQVRLGKGLSATDIFEEAKATLETSSNEQFVLGQIAEQGGLSADALRVYRQLAESTDAAWASRAALRVGVLLEGQGDAAGAQAAYQKALSLDDGNLPAMNNLALLLVGSKRTWEDAARFVPFLTANLDRPAFLPAKSPYACMPCTARPCLVCSVSWEASAWAFPSC